MSELENIKPVAFYRADWKGGMMFRKNNTIDVRKNKSDFTKGLIKPLYSQGNIDEIKKELDAVKNQKSIKQFDINDFEPAGVMIYGGYPLNRSKTISHLGHYDLSGLVKNEDYEFLYTSEQMESCIELTQPQLTIPKSIAEMIDKEIMADAVTKFAMFHEGFERLWLSDELEMYCADKENYALASAYLAGKALGVDLVKVVEG